MIYLWSQYLFQTVAISDITISQGSVATHMRCSGIFGYHFTENLQLSLTVKEFRKSVKIDRVITMCFVSFFETKCRNTTATTTTMTTCLLYIVYSGARLSGEHWVVDRSSRRQLTCGRISKLRVVWYFSSVLSYYRCCIFFWCLQLYRAFSHINTA